MRTIDAFKRLVEKDKEKVHVFSKKELGDLFEAQGSSLSATIERLTQEDILVRAFHGIYVNKMSANLGLETYYEIVKRMRPGKLIYESFESAAFEWDLISQAPMIGTFATTGKSGYYVTAYGGVEFTHKNFSAEEMAANTVTSAEYGRLPFATKSYTEADMRKFNRSVDLLEEHRIRNESGILNGIKYYSPED